MEVEWECTRGRPGQQGQAGHRHHKLDGARPPRSVIDCSAFVLAHGCPTEGTDICPYRAVRYLSSHPRGADVPSRNGRGNVAHLGRQRLGWGFMSRKSCSGGYIQRQGETLRQCSNTQANVALSSGEAELHGAAKGISEGIGVASAIRDLVGESRTSTLSVGASAHKGMPLRTGTGKGKYLSAKQHLVRAAILSWGVDAQHVPRAEHA